MSYRITVTVDVDTEEQAKKCMSDMEEAAGKNNAELQWAEYEDLDEIFGTGGPDAKA